MSSPNSRRADVDVHRDFRGIIGDVHGPVTIVGSVPADPSAYLRHVAETCNVVWCPGSENDPAGRMQLLEVYADLHTREPREEEPDDEHALPKREAGKKVSALQSVVAHHRLALLGDPGGGKSTFLRFLAVGLANHHLNPDSESGQRLAKRGFPAALLDCFPVWVELRELPIPAESEVPKKWLWDAIKDPISKDFGDAAVRILEDAATSGRLLFLLDGLDEVTDYGRRRFLRRAVWHLVTRTFDAAGTSKPNRFILTCRERTWFSGKEKNQSWRIEEWTTENFAEIRTVERFDREDRRNFLRQWFEERARLACPDYLTASEKEAAIRFAEQLRNRHTVLDREIADSTRNRGGRLESLLSVPLNLTMVAWLRSQPDAAELPLNRSAIFEETIHAILWDLDKHKKLTNPEDRTLPKLVDLSPAPSRREDFVKVLAKIAYDSLQTQPLGPAPNFPELTLVRDLEVFCGQEFPEDPGDWARKVLKTMQCRAGLLKDVDGSSYKFAHRSFQEFLAGLHLVTSGKFFENSLTWLQDRTSSIGGTDIEARQSARERLWEPLMLACGFLAAPSDRGKKESRKLISGLRDRGMARELIQYLVEERDGESWTDVWLAGELWLELALPETPTGVWADRKRQVQRRLVRLIEESALTPFERAAAGRVLGNLGDPRPGVTPMAPFSVANPLFAWSKVMPALKGFKLGEGPVRDIPEQYRLARYPVTVAQYALFVQAEDGYGEDRWWTEAGRRWKGSEGITGPRDFDQPVFQTPNHPRVGVSWYEARAYALWLNKNFTAEQQGLEKGWRIRLPSEAEWEYAASNGGTQAYPFADQSDWSRHGNIVETGIGHTTVVGLFQAGRASSCGADDLSGNVWEWCRSRYQDDQDGSEDEEGDQHRCLRGGAWSYDPDVARASYRFGFDPRYRDLSVGFRLAASPISEL